MQDQKLKLAVELAQKQVDLEAKLQKNEDDRKEMNKEIEGIRGGFQQEGKLPALMQELELSELTLENGQRIVVNKELKLPSLAASSKHREKVIAWLKSSGNKDLIRSTINAEFTQDANDQRLENTIKELERLHVPFDNFQSANAAQFKKLINDMVEAGEEVPVEELGILQFRQTEIKVKK